MSLRAPSPSAPQSLGALSIPSETWLLPGVHAWFFPPSPTHPSEALGESVPSLPQESGPWLGRLPGLLQIHRVQEYKSPSTLQEALRGRSSPKQQYRGSSTLPPEISAPRPPASSLCVLVDLFHLAQALQCLQCSGQCLEEVGICHGGRVEEVLGLGWPSGETSCTTHIRCVAHDFQGWPDSYMARNLPGTRSVLGSEQAAVPLPVNARPFPLHSARPPWSSCPQGPRIPWACG